MVKCGDGRTPQVLLIFGNQGKASGHPTEESPAFHHPSCSPGKKTLTIWDCKLGLRLTWTGPALQPTALGWALAAAPVTTKHKLSPCARTVLDYLASAFLHFTTQQDPVLSISQHQESGFEGAFFVCLFPRFIWRHDIICQTRRLEAESIKFPLWRDPSANAVPSVADTAGNKVN